MLHVDSMVNRLDVATTSQGSAHPLQSAKKQECAMPAFEKGRCQSFLFDILDDPFLERHITFQQRGRAVLQA